MAIPIYFAMTAAELSSCTAFPTHVAWMACHFSSSNKGISNLPEALPAGSMLILDDSFPPNGHDPALVRKQLHEAAHTFRCSSILLDLQRPKNQETAAIIAAIVQDPPCPVGLPPDYARPGLPILLPPVPLDTPIEAYLAPWTGAEIWLELAPECAGSRIDATGCAPVLPPCPRDTPWWDEQLHCHYAMALAPDHIDLFLHRTAEDIPGLLTQGKALGITKAVGLWQELKALSPSL